MLSVPPEIPTDYAIYSVLFDTAVKEKIRYIFEGHSFRVNRYIRKGRKKDQPVPRADT